MMATIIAKLSSIFVSQEFVLQLAFPRRRSRLSERGKVLEIDLLEMDLHFVEKTKKKNQVKEGV